MGEQQQHLACLFPQRLRNHISNDPCWRDLVKQCWCESPWERAAASSAKPQRRGRGQPPPLIQSKTSSLAERIRGGWWRWWGGTAGSLCYYPKSSTFRQKPLLLWTSQTVWQQTDLHHRFSRRRQVDRWGDTWYHVRSAVMLKAFHVFILLSLLIQAKCKQPNVKYVCVLYTESNKLHAIRSLLVCVCTLNNGWFSLD